MTDLEKIMRDTEEYPDTKAEKPPTTFYVGDTVLLKSGSHPMVVTDPRDVCNRSQVSCCWMSPDGTLHRNSFEVELLQRADTNEKYSLQKQLDLLNLQLQIQKLEGFKDQLKKERMNLSNPLSDRFPRKIR